MRGFDENIRSFFEGADVPLDNSSWNSFEQKWDDSQMNELIFTQKVVNSLQFSLVPYSPTHWDQMSTKLDGSEAGSFENIVASKLELGSVAGANMGWDLMSDKLQESELSNFDRGVKNQMTSGEIPYNPQHWKAFEKTLSSKKTNKKILYVAAGLLAIALGFVGESMVGSTDFPEAGLSASETLNNIEGVGNTKLSSGMESATEFAQESNGAVGGKVYSDKIEGVGAGSQLLTTEVFQSGVSNGYESKNGKIEKTVIKELSDNFAKATAVDIVSGQADVNASLPLLNLFDLDVQTKPNIKANEVLPLHVAVILPFWENAAITGLSGAKNISFFTDLEWQNYYLYGEHIGCKFNQPSLLLAGYEDHLKNEDWSVGTFFKNVKSDHWNRAEFNVTMAYEKSLGNAALRLGGGVKYQRNQLLSDQLQLQENVVKQGEIETIQKLVSDFEIPAEQSVSVNVAAVLSSKFYTVAYQASNALLARVNFKSTLAVHHELMMMTNVYYQNIQASGFCKFNYNGRGVVSPGFGITYKNSFFATAEYKNMMRATITLGKQFRNGLRVYSGYGSMTNSDTESAIRDVYYQAGHVTAGISYLFK